VLQQVSNGVHVRMAVLFHLLVGTESAAEGLGGKGIVA
jgi:aspartate carbamoyltransferase catalytic subunit